jgi:hypothetical protein
MWDLSIYTFLNIADKRETEYMVALYAINFNLKYIYIYIVITECVAYNMRFTSVHHLSKQMN